MAYETWIFLRLFAFAFPSLFQFLFWSLFQFLYPFLFRSLFPPLFILQFLFNSQFEILYRPLIQFQRLFLRPFLYNFLYNFLCPCSMALVMVLITENTLRYCHLGRMIRNLMGVFLAQFSSLWTIWLAIYNIYFLK